jgi:hypothetical protein
MQSKKLPDHDSIFVDASVRENVATIAFKSSGAKDSQVIGENIPSHLAEAIAIAHAVLKCNNGVVYSDCESIVKAFRTVEIKHISREDLNLKEAHEMASSLGKKILTLQYQSKNHFEDTLTCQLRKSLIEQFKESQKSQKIDPHFIKAYKKCYHTIHFFIDLMTGNEEYRKKQILSKAVSRFKIDRSMAGTIYKLCLEFIPILEDAVIRGKFLEVQKRALADIKHNPYSYRFL